MDSRGAGGRKSHQRHVRTALSYEYIIQTALALIDREGTESLSMRKLGNALGVDPMAVYYYLPNKAALFDGVVEAVYVEVDFESLPEVNSREMLETFTLRLREALRRHANAVPLIATRPAYTAGVLAFGDRALGRFQEEGAPLRDALNVVNCLRAFVVGHVLAEVGEPVGGDTLSAGEAAEVMTAESYPFLAQAITGGYNSDEQFTMGLSAMLDGFAPLLEGGGQDRVSSSAERAG